MIILIKSSRVARGIRNRSLIRQEHRAHRNWHLNIAQGWRLKAQGLRALLNEDESLSDADRTLIGKDITLCELNAILEESNECLNQH